MAQMFLTDNNPLDGTFEVRQFVNKLPPGQVGFFNMWFSPGPVRATSTLRSKIPKAEIQLKTLWDQERSYWEGPAYSCRFSSRDLKMIFFAPRAMRLKKNRPWRGPKRAYFLPPGGGKIASVPKIPPPKAKSELFPSVQIAGPAPMGGFHMR